MKKLITALLIVMMAFSCALAVSADEDNTPTFSTSGVARPSDGVYEYSVYVTVTFPKGNDEGGRIFDITGKVGDEEVYHLGGSYGETADASGANMNKFSRMLWGTCGETIEVTIKVIDGYSAKEDNSNVYSQTYKINLSDDQADYELKGHKFGGIYGGYEIAGSGVNGAQPQTIKLLKEVVALDYAPNENVTIDMNGNNLSFNTTSATNSCFSIINSGETGKFVFNGDKQMRFTSDVSKYIPDGYEEAKIDDTYYVFKTGTSVEIPTGATGATVAIPNDIANDFKGYSGSPDFDSNDVKIVEATIDTTASVNSDQKEIIETKAKEIMSEGTVSRYIDLTLLATDSNGNSAEITELNNSAKITIFLDENTNNDIKGKDFKVIRLHNEEAEELESEYNESNKTLTITSDRFSIYAIVVEKKKDDGGSTDKPSQNTTSTVKKHHVSCEEYNKSNNWTWSESQGKCVYRVSNTSAK